MLAFELFQQLLLLRDESRLGGCWSEVRVEFAEQSAECWELTRCERRNLGIRIAGLWLA